MAEPTRSRQIGKYQIQAELGRGGFGSVYRAYDPTVGRLVAIKVLTTAGDQNLLTRFKNEAAAAGNLRHKNIVTIYDFGDQEGLPYIVMEFLEGEDLQHIISRNKPLTLLEKVSIMLQVADGLHCAHRSGIVHRDVKPGNIRLLPDGTVKIMDFGIARLVAEGSGGTRLTRQGYVIGTLPYMAPEQLHGNEVDFLCDIFAYGVTYYELLSGKHPFHGSDPRAVFYRITNEDPDRIRNLVPECPEALEAILHRTLHKERELRYQSLREVQLDTEPLLIELRQEEALQLLSEATRLYSGGQLDGALAVLNEAFDLDPGNREARQLRETIQGKLLRRVIEPKVEALLKKADRQIAERQFQEAIGTFEAALRLDRENAEVKQQLDRARDLLNVSRESARGLAEARRKFSRNNLEAALEALPPVLEQDPGNPEARQLLKDVQQELDRRERERRYEQKLQRARDLLEANRFEEALDELNIIQQIDGVREEASRFAAEIKQKQLAFVEQQKFREELTSAQELLATDQYEAAIPRLERLMNQYPEEPEATKLFIAVHKKLAAQRKGEALENLGIELSRLLEAREFDRAREKVNDALREYPAEKHLLEAARGIDDERERWRREEAVREALDKAYAHVAQESPELAVQVLEAAAGLYPDEDRLRAELSAARTLQGQKLRDEAIDAVCREAHSSVELREFDRALSAIDHGLTVEGQDQRFLTARDRVLEARSQWQRAEAVRSALKDAHRCLANDDPLQAVETLDAALARYPLEDELINAVNQARQALLRKQREQAIQTALLQAGSDSDDRQFDRALDLIDETLFAHGPDVLLSNLRDCVAQAKSDWDREQDILETIRDVEHSLRDGAPQDALDLLDKALERYPNEDRLSLASASAREALASAQRESSVQALCGDVSAWLERREFDWALEGLEHGLHTLGADNRLTALRGRVVSERDAWIRTETIRAALELSNQQLLEDDPESALRTLDAANARCSGYPHLETAVAAARRALELKHRERAIGAAQTTAGSQLDSGELDSALAELDRAIADYGQDPRLTELRDRVFATKAKRQQDQAIRQAIAESNRRLSLGNPEGALETAKAALAQYPDDQAIAALAVSVRQALETKGRSAAIKKIAARVGRLLKTQQFAPALLAVEEGLDTYENDSRLIELRDRVVAATEDWNREQNVRQSLARAAELQGMDQVVDALEELRQALERYPGDVRLATAYREIKSNSSNRPREFGDGAEDAIAPSPAPDPEKTEILSVAALDPSHGSELDKAIDAVCSQTQEFLNRSEFASALNSIENGFHELGDEPRLIAMRETVQASMADFERAQGMRQVVEGAGRCTAEGQPKTATETLGKATKVFGPVDTRSEALAETKVAVEEKQRREEVERLCRLAQAELDAQRLDNCAQLLEDAERSLGTAQEFSLLRQRVNAAVAEHRRAEAVNHAIREINALIAQGAYDDAVNAADAAIAQFANGSELIAIRSQAVQGRAAKQKDQAIEKLCSEIRAIANRGDSNTALKKIKQGQKAHGFDRRFEQLCAEITTRKPASEPRRSDAAGPARAPLSPPPAARYAPPVSPTQGARRPSKLWLIGTEIAVAIAAAIVVWLGYGRPSRAARLEVNASPQSALVQVEDQTCTNGHCSFDLKPGVHHVRIAANGYQSRTEDIRITPGAKPPPIDVALKPFSPTLQVAANVAQGQVSLDGRPAGRLLDGQFSLDSVQPGKHELRILGSDYSARVTFQSEFASTPVLQTIAAEGVDVVALGNFGNQASVLCPKCSGSLTLDDSSPHEAGKGIFTVRSLSAGTHRLHLTTESGERNIVFNAGEEPALTLSLTSNRNYGTLVIETGEDGASVFIDGKRYSRTIARGQVLTQVEAKEHTVHVTKEGFRAEPAEFRGEVTKGSQLQARFRLTPLPARLFVTGAVPGTRISIDGSLVGTVAQGGAFSAQVNPGKHQIEFARDGFTPAQVSRDFGPGRAVQLSQGEVQMNPLPQAAAQAKAPPKTVPDETARPDPAEVELADWQRVARNPTVADVEDFLQKHRRGANVTEAQRLLERLEWNTTNRNNKTDLQQFLSKFPDGAHSQEARVALASIEKAETDEIAAAQYAREQVARSENDLQNLSRILKAFEDAYNRRDLAELQRIWNPMPRNFVESYRNQFREAKTLAFQIRLSGAPSFNGDSATAVCNRTLSFTARNGERPPETSERVRVVLDRTGSSWTIRSISPF